MFHSLFWLSWVLSFTVIQSLGKGNEAGLTWLVYYLVTLPVFMAHTYLISYWLVPTYFFKNRFFLFSSWIAVLLVVFSILELIISNELVFKILSPDMQFGTGYLNLKNIVISGVGNHYIILVFLAIRAGKSWYTAKTENDILIRQNLETEAEIFRHQFQPKIVSELICELETIASEKPEKVPDLIVSISEFMNQLIYENPDMIPVSSEIKLIDQYLRVQKIILGNHLKTETAVSGNLAAWLIPPLSVLPFLNNLVQNISHDPQDFEVNMIVKAEKNYLLFSLTIWSDGDFDFIENNFAGDARKRLNLCYQGKHRIIENSDSNFREFAMEIYRQKM